MRTQRARGIDYVNIYPINSETSVQIPVGVEVEYQGKKQGWYILVKFGEIVGWIFRGFTNV